ncbi:hypothetical protein BSKO_11824 [Bryopsis sp. KO-2023]|nr:hypothetical protein BSKO_11824 [Bryopsis sp. KO-2023]
MGGLAFFFGQPTHICSQTTKRLRKTPPCKLNLARVVVPSRQSQRIVSLAASREIVKWRRSKENVVDVLKVLGRRSKSRRKRKIPFDAEELQAWRDCSKMILNDLSNLTAFGLAFTIHSCRMAGYWDLKLIQELVEHAKRHPRLVAEYNPISCSMTIQSLGMMALTQRKKRDRRAMHFFENSGLDFLGLVMETCLRLRTFEEATYAARGLASSMHGLGAYCGSMAKKPELLQGFSEAIVEEFVRKGNRGGVASAQDFSTLLHGLANIHFEDEARLKSICDLLQEMLSSGEVEFGQQALSNIVWSLSKLDCNDREVLGLLSERIKGEVGDMTSQGLANIVYGFGVLGYNHPGALSALGKESIKPHRLDRFNCQALVNIIYGLGQVGFQERKVLSKLAREISKPHRLKLLTHQGAANLIYSFGLSGFHDKQVLEVLLEEILQSQRLKQSSEQELAIIVYGLGLVGYCNRSHLSTLGKEIIKENRLRGCTDQGLVNIVYGYGKCQFFDKEIFLKLMDEAEGRFSQLTPQGIANVFYSLALMEMEITDSIPEQLLRMLESLSSGIDRRGLVGFDTQALSNLFWSLGELRYRDARLLSDLITAYMHEAERRPEGIQVEQLSMILNACALLDFHDKGFFEVARNWLPSRVDDERTTTNVMWSMAVLGILSLPEFEHQCDRLVTLQNQGHEISTGGSMQVAQASLHISIISGEEFNPRFANLVENCREASYSPTQESSFERIIQKMLLNEGLSYETNKRLVQDILSVDVFIPGTPGLVIECDGPTHYTINKVDGEYRRMGDTIFRNRLLEASGYKVVCLPYFLTGENLRMIVRDAIVNLH